MSKWEDFQTISRFEDKVNRMTKEDTLEVLVRYRNNLTKRYIDDRKVFTDVDAYNATYFDIQTSIARRRLAEIRYEKTHSRKEACTIEMLNELIEDQRSLLKLSNN